MAEAIKRPCSLGECDAEAGSGGILCPPHKAELETTLFSRPAALAEAAKRGGAAGHNRQDG
jgi:hypothetical protein